MSAFDSRELHAKSEIKELDLPTEKIDATYITDAPKRTSRAMVAPGQETEEKRVELEAKQSTFGFGWVSYFFAWVKGLFRSK